METSTKYVQYAARIPKVMGFRGAGAWGVGNRSFDVQGWWGLAQFGPIRTDKKGRRGGGAKIGHSSWIS